MRSRNFLSRVLVLGLLFLLAPGLAEPFQHEGQGFVVTVPEGWKVKDKELAFGCYLTARAPGDDPYSPSLQVTIWPGGMTPQKYFERQKMQLQGTAEKMSFRAEEFAGQEGGLLTYTVNGALRTTSAFTPHKGKMYVLSTTARVKEYEKMEETFQAIRSSFKLAAEAEPETESE